MLRPRWRKVFADLWENKVRTLLVIVSIAAGVFAIGLIAGAYVLIPQDMNFSYTRANPANIKIMTDSFDDDLVKSISRMDGVEEVEPRRIFSVRLKNNIGEWTRFDLVVVPDFSNIKINKVIHQEGQFALNNRDVIIEGNENLERIDVALGEELSIELLDGTNRNLNFTGTIVDETSGINNIIGNVRGFITFDTLEWLGQPESYNYLYITLSKNQNDRAYIQMMTDRITDQLEKSGRQVYKTEQFLKNRHPFASMLQALLGILFILGILVVFLSGSLIANTLSALFNQHLRQIGVMKLIGARRSQIISLYIVLIFIFSISALVVAVPLGGAAAYALSDYASSLVGFSLRGFRFTFLAVFLQTIIALLVPPLAGLLPVIKGSRITVQKAINNTSTGDGIIQKSWLDQRMENIRGMSRPLLISLRNTFRRKGRLALTLLTLTLGGAIFISVFNVQVALNQKIEQTAKYFRADINLDFNRLYRTSVIQEHLSVIPGIEKVESWIINSGELLNEENTAVDNLLVFAPPADSSLVEPILLEGRWLLSEDQYAVTINEAFWDNYPSLQTGDNLRLKIDGKEHDWTIVGIFQFTGDDGLYAYTNYQQLSHVMKEPNKASSYRIVTTDHSPAFQEQLSLELDNYFRAIGFRVSKVEAGSAVVETAADYISILTAILLVMAALTALVGSIGLTGTLSMNVLERTREIGIMRAIGAYNQIVMKLVITEGLLIGMISYILSAILSFPITSLLSNTISIAIFNAPANFAFTLQGFIIWLIVVLILSAVSSITPARSASQMTIREVLAYE